MPENDPTRRTATRFTDDSELALGSAVEVLSPFNQTWVGGFTGAGHTPTGYRLRRNSDGTVLPAIFSPSDIRARR